MQPEKVTERDQDDGRGLRFWPMLGAGRFPHGMSYPVWLSLSIKG